MLIICKLILLIDNQPSTYSWPSITRLVGFVTFINSIPFQYDKTNIWYYNFTFRLTTKCIKKVVTYCHKAMFDVFVSPSKYRRKAMTWVELGENTAKTSIWPQFIFSYLNIMIFLKAQNHLKNVQVEKVLWETKCKVLSEHMRPQSVRKTKSRI